MKLQIVIPTYSRAERLASTLEALRPQLGDIKVHVIDNGSSPPTRSYAGMEAFSESVVWHQNRANIGGTGNILRCFEVADSDYFWLLSDDDGPLPDAIAKIRSTLSTHPGADYACFSTGYCRHDSTRQFNSIQEFLTIPDALRGASLITSGVYRTETFRKLLPEAYSQAGSNFPHVALILIAARSTSFLGVVASDLIADWKAKADVGNWPILLMFNLLQLSELLTSRALKEDFMVAIRFDSGMYFRMLIELAHLRNSNQLSIDSALHFIDKVMCHYRQPRPFQGTLMQVLAKSVVRLPGLSLSVLKIAYRRFKGQEFVSYARQGQQHF